MKVFFFIQITPTIRAINTVHKENVIKLKCFLYTNITSSLSYWREVVFVLTFFGLAACLLIFLWSGFVYDTCTWVFSMNDVRSPQRWFPRARALPSLTRQQSRYGPEVIAPAVTAKILTLARGEDYLLRTSAPSANHVMPHINNSSVL